LELSEDDGVEAIHPVPNCDGVEAIHPVPNCDGVEAIHPVPNCDGVEDLPGLPGDYWTRHWIKWISSVNRHFY